MSKSWYLLGLHVCTSYYMYAILLFYRLCNWSNEEQCMKEDSRKIERERNTVLALWLCRIEIKRKGPDY